MVELQWLAMLIVTTLAVVIAVSFGFRNLGIAMSRAREAGYASGRLEARLEILERRARESDAKLEAHDLILREAGSETNELSKRLRRQRP